MLHETKTPEGHLAELRRLLVGTEQAAIDELRNDIGALDQRLGTPEKFERAVSKSLVAALKRAEVENHRELSGAIAPLVVAGIRREISDSRDMMVEALYPITGRLVSTAVSKAFRHLLQDINDRLESALSPNRWKLRVKALITGRPYSELVLAEATMFRPQQILLIERHAGTLVASWPHPDDGIVQNGPSLDMVGSMLSAILDFSRETFVQEGGDLRALDLGGRTVFLRASPRYTVATVGAGIQTPRVESIIDDAFLAFLERMPANSADEEQFNPDSELSALRDDIAAAIDEGIERKRPKLAYLILAAVLIGLATVGFYWGWQFYQDRQLHERLAKIESSDTLQGYPLTVVHDGDRAVVRLRGMVPSEAAREAIVAEATAVAAGQTIDPRLIVVDPSRFDDFGSRIETLADDLGGAGTTLEAQAGRLAALEATVAGLATGLSEKADRTDLAAATQRLDQIAEALPEKAAQTAVANLAGDIDRLRQGLDGLSALTSAAPWREGTSANAAAIATMEQAIATLEHGLGDAVAGLDQKIAALEAQVAAAAPAESVAAVSGRIQQLESEISSPKTRIADFILQNAVFFVDGTVYRNDVAAGRVIGQITELMAADPSLRLRVIGHADDLGAREANKVVAQKRAEKVVGDLRGSGIERNRLVTVGRPEAPAIADQDGPNSANRRVTFEFAFDGE